MALCLPAKFGTAVWRLMRLSIQERLGSRWGLHEILSPGPIHKELKHGSLVRVTKGGLRAGLRKQNQAS